jgi:hypothetical protein
MAMNITIFSQNLRNKYQYFVHEFVTLLNQMATLARLTAGPRATQPHLQYNNDEQVKKHWDNSPQELGAHKDSKA